IREQVGKERVICALSGGVDSSVAAALTHRAIGDQLTCMFVDNGVLRAGERDQVQKTFASQLHLNVRILDGTTQFLADLKNVTDPERKRKIIGRQFIKRFKAEVRVLGTELGLPDEIIWRQPFPGPGLAIRVLGAVTPERLAILRAAEAILDREIRSAGLYREIWQA